jgi:hypothetical protein
VEECSFVGTGMREGRCSERNGGKDRDGHVESGCFLEPSRRTAAAVNTYDHGSDGNVMIVPAMLKIDVLECRW